MNIYRSYIEEVAQARIKKKKILLCFHHRQPFGFSMPDVYIEGWCMGMADQIRNRVCIELGEKLGGHSLRSLDSCIFKVPYQLRRINEKAYEPQIISIGPYHRGKEHLKSMEIHKLHYLRTLLQRRNEDVGRYVDAMRAIEDRARNCYEEAVDDISPEAFVEMMILDGCFIVEHIRRSFIIELREENDQLFGVRSITEKITHDLLLLENQLPFFVLLELFGMSCNEVMPNDSTNGFIRLALAFFIPILPGPGIRCEECCSLQDIRHLLGLLHDHWLPSPQGIERYQKPQGHGTEWQFIRSASELREAGIKFEKIPVESKYKKVEAEGDSLFDIRFEHGRMRIPTLSVYNDTERLFRNLMAYEQFIIDPTYVTDYITFMDTLINSGKDVEILCRRGIINNWLGDDEGVATMFNSLRVFIFSLGENFYYAQAFNAVNKHRNRRCNIWKANLRHNYCNTPWAMISFLAASALLLLALAQTIFSVLSYFK